MKYHKWRKYIQQFRCVAKWYKCNCLYYKMHTCWRKLIKTSRTDFITVILKITNKQTYTDIQNMKYSRISPQNVLVDTGFCVDDLLQTSNGRQLTYMADNAAENNSVNDQWWHQWHRQSRTIRQPSAAGKHRSQWWTNICGIKDKINQSYLMQWFSSQWVTVKLPRNHAYEQHSQKNLMFRWPSNIRIYPVSFRNFIKQFTGYLAQH